MRSWTISNRGRQFSAGLGLVVMLSEAKHLWLVGLLTRYK
jgi:hypothetical protein